MMNLYPALERERSYCVDLGTVVAASGLLLEKRATRGNLNAALKYFYLTRLDVGLLREYRRRGWNLEPWRAHRPLFYPPQTTYSSNRQFAGAVDAQAEGLQGTNLSAERRQR
jgi:hypothetical protein